jgi:hypothetical protein
MTSPSNGSRAIARRIAEVIGRRPEVFRWRSEHFPELEPIDILIARDWPSRGRRAAFTLGLADEPLGLGDPEYELALVLRDKWDVEQLLGDVAVRVRRHIFIPAPGEAVFHGLAPSVAEERVKHLLAVEPVTAELRFEMPPLQPAVAYLQLVPIGDVELEMAETTGGGTVLRVLTDAGLDICDLGRDVLEARP